MNIYYNNQPMEVPEDVTIIEVIASVEEIEHKAVWLNGRHLMLEEFHKTLNPYDRIKVIRIRGGG